MELLLDHICSRPEYRTVPFSSALSCNNIELADGFQLHLRLCYLLSLSRPYALPFVLESLPLSLLQPLLTFFLRKPTIFKEDNVGWFLFFGFGLFCCCLFFLMASLFSIFPLPSLKEGLTSAPALFLSLGCRRSFVAPTTLCCDYLFTGLATNSKLLKRRK